MRQDKNPNFSQLVCSTQPVQEAFALHRPTRLWWRLILLLHGKPVNVSLSAQERIARVADGFKFYASLYRFLAAIFLLLTPTFLALNALEKSTSWSYWAAASFLAFLYLWSVSGLGYVGANSYRTGQGTSALVAFMVMIVAFLSMFVAAVSVLAHQLSWVATAPNLLGAGILFVFGIGSYLIEIIYLSTKPSGNRSQAG
jgi:hypothetical protein